MRLSSIMFEEEVQCGMIIPQGAIPIKLLNERFHQSWPIQLESLINLKVLSPFQHWIGTLRETLSNLSSEMVISSKNLHYAPLYRHPSKIWGIGLNYREHAADLSESCPQGIPGSFIKADTTIIGDQDPIILPKISHKITGEAELGLIIGRECKDVSQDHWQEVVAGYTCIIDMTAEDILRQNPRYLTVAKNFDTFFSFGPQLITPDEVPQILDLSVATIINHTVHARNFIRNMTFPPDYLVSFHSQVMTLRVGDIISTGTPKAVELHHGDRVGCQIDGFPLLENPVRDLKV
jgi:2-keto-4-pentenoate hydratase/2-oxohepta-3-ene-1,7-dioic acid hydratase in catechol pathway